MTISALAEDYLRWLEPQLKDEFVNQGETYWDLLRIMFDKDFDKDGVWLVPNDDNRLADGLDLRTEFCYAYHIRADALRSLKPASFLEVFIGLSRRLAFIAGGTPRGWAWQFLVNLELTRMTDPLSRYKVRRVNDIMDTVIQRTYQPNGLGGFFPLSWPEEDQRQVELWYQMAAYIDEIHPEH